MREKKESTDFRGVANIGVVGISGHILVSLRSDDKRDDNDVLSSL